MSGRPGVGKARARGNIEELASGALRVRVYAGIDPVTKSLLANGLMPLVDLSDAAAR
jgi:hypothetical protein